MKIAVGSDADGRALADAIRAYLESRGHAVVSTEGGAFAAEAAEKVSRGQADAAVLVDISGAFGALVANKTRGIRAAQVGDRYSARLTKAHNDANVLCFGYAVTTMETALDCVGVWLDTEFMSGNHPRRVAMMTDMEARFHI